MFIEKRGVKEGENVMSEICVCVGWGFSRANLNGIKCVDVFETPHFDLRAQNALLIFNVRLE